MKLFVCILALLVAVSVARSGCARQRIKLRHQLLQLHKRAARCEDTDTECTTRLFNHIARVRHRMASLKHRKCRNGHVSRHETRGCHLSFSQFLARRRARINRIAQKCGDEDDSCVQTSMELLEALNRDHRRQRRLWRQKCLLAKGRRRRHTSLAELHRLHNHVSKHELREWRKRYEHTDLHLPEEKWVPMSVWSHRFVCSRIRAGFHRWLKSQVRRREMFHKDSAKCKQSDLACLRMNFQSIIHIQRHIHRGRKLYTERMRTCDRCAHIKVKWARWMRRQRIRRHRLQIQACRCDENDAPCMQEKVDEIKKIQKKMHERIRRAFALHGSCHLHEVTRDPLLPTTSDKDKETPIPDL